MKIDLSVECQIDLSPRVRQLEAMFDCPVAAKSRIHFTGDFPFESEPWNVGLIVGPSGCGKSTMLRTVFGEPAPMAWGAKSVIDDFDSALSMTDISGVCQSVGFNTIPAWMRPYAVLSTGEKFRVELARRLLETDGVIVVDEFTSVVDRQVAQIGSHAVQKWVRKHNRQFVAASCHYDVIDWLQPDWIFEPGTMTFRRRCLQRRPQLDITISPVDYSAWRLFAPFHYLTSELHRACRCFVLFVHGNPAAFAGMIHRPVKDAAIMGCSRLVTLPDYQGLGLAFVLIDAVAAAYKTLGKRTHCYPAHPALIRAFDKSPKWGLVKKPGLTPRASSATRLLKTKHQGGRPNAVFVYAGDPLPHADAVRLLQCGA